MRNSAGVWGAARGTVAVVVAAVALGLGGAGSAAASEDGTARPAPPSERSRAATPGAARAALRAVYPPAPPPPPAPAVPAICLQRTHILCASKAEKTLRFFENGSLWLATPVAFGRPGYATPTGLYAVRIKDANAWSYEFNAPMPYSLEYDLVRGIYIHYSATYAAIGPTYIGSHGCINIGSLATARTLFHRVPLGAAVYVY